MEDKDVFILDEIIGYCDKITDVISKRGRSFESFRNDTEYQDLCAFRAMQVGEYVNSLSEKFKNNHPDIPWYKIVAFRNIISHDYGKIDYEIM